MNPKIENTTLVTNNSYSLDQTSIFRCNDESAIKVADTICSTGVKEDLLKNLTQ